MKRHLLDEQPCPEIYQKIITLHLLAGLYLEGEQLMEPAGIAHTLLDEADAFLRLSDLSFQYEGGRGWGLFERHAAVVESHEYIVRRLRDRELQRPKYEGFEQIVFCEGGLVQRLI